MVRSGSQHQRVFFALSIFAPESLDRYVGLLMHSIA